MPSAKWGQTDRGARGAGVGLRRSYQMGRGRGRGGAGLRFPTARRQRRWRRVRAPDRAVSAEIAGAPGARVWRHPGRGRCDRDCRVPSSGAATQATPSDRRDRRGERARAGAEPLMDPTPQLRSCRRRENEPSGHEKWRPLPAAGAPFPLPILAIRPPPGHSTA